MVKKTDKNKAILGSKTAKGGFANEKSICRKFNNWKNDNEAKEWLNIMDYNVEKLSSVNAIQVPTRIKAKDLKKFNITKNDYDEFVKYKKSDAQITIIIKIGDIVKIENLSLKKANSNAGFNQIDKRTVNAYQEMWSFDDEIAKWLKLFTGETSPEKQGINIKLKDKRRIFIDEMPKNIQDKIVEFFNKNKILIISDILKGRGGLSANWMLVTEFNKKNKSTSWILKDINTVMNFYGDGDIVISPKGSLNIGKISIQRKGGTPDPTKLQFKFNPCDIFLLRGY